MRKLLLLGDEAIAQGAIDAGLSGVYAYPGTPSTEITEYIQDSTLAKERCIHSKWSSNEKTAMESALGMCYAGKRAMACMKHVGLNVAADAFINAAITGVNGGLVVVVADDPSMHSSQNEQDSRVYGKFAMVPILEPSNQQEAYDMAYHAFDLSEQNNVPVMLRITTRLAHSRSGVMRQPVMNKKALTLPDDPTQFVLLPAMARRHYKKLLSTRPDLEKASMHSKYNQFIDATDRSIGIVACGITYNYLMENFQDVELSYPVLKLSQYPMPRADIEHLLQVCDKILVLEEGYPVVEELLKGYQEAGIPILGRLDGTLPRDGELDPNLVASALHLSVEEGLPVPDLVVPRPPVMCKGCGHIEAYKALNIAMEEYGAGRVFSDIGCYALGALPPYNAINSCVDMGASITMAKGASDAGLHPSVAVIGDSTFTHSGMTGLLDAVSEKSAITVIISDNFTTAMTGGQDSQTLGRLEKIIEGLGVEKEHIRVFKPSASNLHKMVNVIKEELEYKGVSVVIPRRQCIQTMGNQRLSSKIKQLEL